MRTRTIFIFVLISGMLLAGAVAFAEEQCRSERGGYCLSLAAAIPGLEFLGDVPADPGQLLARIFTFGMGFVGIAAFIMLVWGGILYLTARDSQEQVKQARSHMGNAIFGLLLALVSVLILRTINPDLVRIGFPRPTPISRPGGTIPEGTVPGGATKLPPQGFLPPAPAPPTPEGKCSQYYTPIAGKCYAFVTAPPCNPPNFYTYVAGQCFLKRELTPGR